MLQGSTAPADTGTFFRIMLPLAHTRHHPGGYSRVHGSMERLPAQPCDAEQPCPVHHAASNVAVHGTVWGGPHAALRGCCHPFRGSDGDPQHHRPSVGAPRDSCGSIEGLTAAVRPAAANRYTTTGNCPECRLGFLGRIEQQWPVFPACHGKRIEPGVVIRMS